MHERKTTNPLGEIMGEELKARTQVYDVEHAQLQANTAQPFMDKASKLMDVLQSSPWTQGQNGREIIESGEGYGLEPLIHYASYKAELADERGELLQPTYNEHAVLDAYDAEASLVKVQTEYDDELLSFDPDEHLDHLREVAYDNVRSAKSLQEKAYWRKMGERLEDYSAHLRSGATIERWDDRNTSDAGYLLDCARLSDDGDVRTQESVSVQDVKDQTRRMNEEAEMFTFIGQVLRERLESVPEAKPYTGLTPAQVEAMRQQIAGTEIRSARTATVPRVPGDWRKREDFLEQWFESHDDTKTTPENLEVARQWLAETIKMEARKMRMARQANPGLRSARYSGSAAGMFGSGIGNEKLSGVNAVVARAYLKENPDIQSFTSQDYARLKVRALAAALGVTVEDIEPDYDNIFS